MKMVFEPQKNCSMNVTKLVTCRQAMALVSTLCFLTIISGLVVTYVTMVRFDQTANKNYASVLKTEQLALGGVYHVVGELQKEIADPKKNEVISGFSSPSVEVNPSFRSPINRSAQSADFPIFIPKVEGITPERSGISGDLQKKVPTLLKVSRREIAFSSSESPLASSVSTADVSRNGRKIPAPKWNAPQLMSSEALKRFEKEQPDWVLYTATGPMPFTNVQELKKVEVSNKKDAQVIGRFAYSVYEVGGLFDINAGGHPQDTDLSSDKTGSKGLLAFADISKIPGIADVNKFMQWRHAGSRSSYQNYLKSFAAINGFLRVAPGDQTLLSRQDLLRAVSKNSSEIGIGPEALPFLTTFTREKNAPSWFPTTNALNNYEYKKLALNNQKPEAAAVINRALSAVPNPVDPSRPLLETRFPLSKLAFINASAIGSEETERYFGLTRGSPSEPWVYTKWANKGKIAKLHEISGREPNFFELLQAGILDGSLGLASTEHSNMRSADIDTDKTLQIFRIGLNIIDQYDEDSWPTLARLTGSSVPTEVQQIAGIENLPYLSEILLTHYRPQPNNKSANQDAFRQKVLSWLQFELWNPHQNAQELLENGPKEFRIRCQKGNVTAFMKATDGSTVSTDPIDFQNRYLTFNTSQDFAEPTVLKTAHLSGTSSQPLDQFSDGNNKVAGLFIGTINAPDQRLGAPVNFEFTEASASIGAQANNNGQPLTLILEFRDSSGNWQPYQTVLEIGGNNVKSVAEYRAKEGDFRPQYNANIPVGFGSWPVTVWGIGTLDPRTLRFGLYANNFGGSPDCSMRDATELKPESWLAGQDYRQATDAYPKGPNFSYDNASLAAVGFFADNQSQQPNHYSDLDGIVRRADGDSANQAAPLNPGLERKDRPVILNRPFNSVAEMGYAFRDLPWKSLDFFSENSADAGLLDLFTIYEQPTLAAGRINLNAAPKEVLASLLTHTTRDGKSQQEPIDEAQAQDLATQIVSLRETTPFLNKDELFTRYGVEIEASANQPVKNKREAVARSLADVGQTRTWNLLIDVIAQSGRYPNSAENLGDFVVENEKRYWLHLALDRFTGEVVDQQLEPVIE